MFPNPNDRVLLHWRITRCGPPGLGRIRDSDRHRQLVKGGRQDHAGWCIDPEFVVASAQILDEGESSHDHPGGPIAFQATHRSQPRLQPSMIGFDPVVCVLGGVVECEWQELGDGSGQGR